MRYRNTLFLDGDQPFTVDDEQADPGLLTLTQLARNALLDEYSAIKAEPAHTGTPGKRTPAERARLAALARWGKYKGKGKQPLDAKEQQKRQAAADARDKIAAQLLDEDYPLLAKAGLESIVALASGQDAPLGDELVKNGLAEVGADGKIRLSVLGKRAYNMASRGDIDGLKRAVEQASDRAKRKPDSTNPDTPADDADASAIEDAMGKLKPGEQPKEEKPKGGGGGGGGGKGKEKEAKPDKNQEKRQTAAATAERMGLTADDATALYEARENGSAASPRMQALGLLDADGVPTSEGDRALRALEQGDAGAFRRAVRSAVDKRMRDAEAAAPREDAPKHTTRSTRRKDDGTVITVRETKGWLKHGSHNQASHGRRTARRRASIAAYRSARAGGASVEEARAKAKEAGLAKQGERDQRLARMRGNPDNIKPGEQVTVNLTANGRMQQSGVYAGERGGMALVEITNSRTGQREVYSARPDRVNRTPPAAPRATLRDLVAREQQNNQREAALLQSIQRQSSVDKYRDLAKRLQSEQDAIDAERAALRRAFTQLSPADQAAYLTQQGGKAMDADALKYSRRHSASDEAAMQRGMTHLKAARAAFVEAGAPDSDGDGEPDMFEPATKGIPVVGTDYDSVIVCLAVPDDVQALLTDIIDDEDAEPDHVTIWYLGKASALESHKSGVIRALSLLSESAAPIRGTLGGFARFNASESSDNQDVLVALVDSPDLPFAHASVVEAVEDVGVDLTPTHGFIPHITLAYIPPGARTPNLNIPREPVVFDELTLVWAGERIDFPLLGDSWHPEEPEEPVMAMVGDAVKMYADGRVAGYAVRFGDEDQPDISPMRDYFTKSTDFWLNQWDRRPMLYHHAQDPQTADAPVVGAWVKATIDDVGVWLEGQLDQAHRYYGAIKELINRGALKLSSDSAPHLVRRVRHGDAHEVTRWPLLAASLTPTPAEPRLLPVSALKSAFAQAGLLPPAELLERPEAETESVARDADGIKATAANAAAIELELIEIMMLEAA